MSIDTLQRKGLFHHHFKYVGLAISAFCFLYAFLHHFVEANLIFDGLYWPNMIFVAGLLIVINSKEVSEDERANQIRSYIHMLLSGLFIGFLLFEGLTLEDFSTSTIVLSAVLTFYVLVFNYIYYFNTQWIEENQGNRMDTATSQDVLVLYTSSVYSNLYSLCTLMVNITNNLRVERAKLNITQKKLAEEIGVARQTIHSIENGKFTPSVELALKIAQFFDTTVDEVFALKEEGD